VERDWRMGGQRRAAGFLCFFYWLAAAQSAPALSCRYTAYGTTAIIALACCSARMYVHASPSAMRRRAYPS